MKEFMNVYSSWITHNNIHSHHIVNVLTHALRYFKESKKDYWSNMDLITNNFSLSKPKSKLISLQAHYPIHKAILDLKLLLYNGSLRIIFHSPLICF
jgi:hypothetical protein